MVSLIAGCGVCGGVGSAAMLCVSCVDVSGPGVVLSVPRRDEPVCNSPRARIIEGLMEVVKHKIRVCARLCGKSAKIVCTREGNGGV